MKEPLTSRPAHRLTERALSAGYEALRVTASRLAAPWRDRLTRRREAHAGDGIAEMNEHMLKDIGAPDWMISRAAVRREARHPALAASVLAALLMSAAAAPGWAGEAIGTRPNANPTAPTQWIGVFAGQHVDGAPVYRLPALTVIADRKAASARIAREEHLARTKQLPSKVARPPA